MTRALVLLAILGGIYSTGDGAEPKFAYMKQLEVVPLEHEELLATTLDADVYAATRDSFPDLRVLDEDDKEVSFVLRKVQEVRTDEVRKYWTAEKPSVRPLAEGGLEIVGEGGDAEPQAEGVRLVSPLRNFENRVRVFASLDGNQWEPVSEDNLLFDYSQWMDVRNDTIPLKSTDRRRFKIVVDDVTAEQQSQLMELTRHFQGDQETDRRERVTISRLPFRINRVEFWRSERREHVTGDKQAPYPVEMRSVEQSDEDNQTIVRVQSRREPLTELSIVTPTRNYSRRARVEVERTQGIESQWQSIGQDTISQLDFRNLDRSEPGVSFSQRRENEYRIVIDNRNSPPLEITGVEGEGNVYEVVFFSTPGKQYRLVYGSPAAESPSYDVAVITASLGEGYEPLRADLGAQVALPGGGQDLHWTVSRMLSDPWVLGSAIVVLVVVLGWGLFRATRRLADLPQE